MLKDWEDGSDAGDVMQTARWLLLGLRSSFWEGRSITLGSLGGECQSL